MSRGRARVCVAVISLAALLAAGIHTAGAQGQAGQDESERAAILRGNWGLSTSPDRISRLASDPDADRTYNIPLTDAEVREMDGREAIQNGVVGLNDYINAHPQRFGEPWIDQSAGGVIVVPLTDEARDSDRQAIEESVSEDIDIRFVETRHSMAELYGALHHVIDLVTEHDPMVDGVVGWGIFIGEDQVRIEVIPQRLEAVEAELGPVLGKELVYFVGGGGAENTACNSRSDCWEDPLRGGLKYWPPQCSTGAMVHTPGGSIRMLTAGHCLTGSSTDYRHSATAGQRPLGQKSKNAYWDGSYADFGLLNLDGSPDWPGHKFYFSSAETGRSIEGTGTVMNGDLVRLSGWKSGLGTTDEVISRTYSSNNLATGVTLFFQALGYYEWDFGDSGGPVFYGHTLYGIQSGCRSDRPQDPCDPWQANHQGDQGFFSEIDQLPTTRTQSNTGALFDVTVCTTGGSSVC